MESQDLHWSLASEPRKFYLPHQLLKTIVLFFFYLNFGIWCRKILWLNPWNHHNGAAPGQWKYMLHGGSVCMSVVLCEMVKSSSLFICKAGAGSSDPPEEKWGSTNNFKGVMVDFRKHRMPHAAPSLLEWVWWQSLPSLLIFYMNFQPNSLDWWLSFPSLFYEFFRSPWILIGLSRSLQSFLWMIYS